MKETKVYPATQGFVPVGFSDGVISARNSHAIPGKSKYAGVAVHGACGMIGGIRILAPVGLTNGLWRDGSNSCFASAEAITPTP